MKGYSTASNAKRAANSIAARFGAHVLVTPPPRDEAAWYLAVEVQPGHGLSDDQLTALGEVAVVAVKLADKALSAATGRRKSKPPLAGTDPTKATGKSRKALDLMGQEGGCSAAELRRRLGWGAHTLRGWVSLTNKGRREAGLAQILTMSREGVGTIYLDLWSRPLKAPRRPRKAN
jgi:hypothetical protein